LIEEIKALNDPTTTNEDALRVLACSKTGEVSQQANTLGVKNNNLRASNISQMGKIRSRYKFKILINNN
jgi:hypothetical protein